MYVATVGAGEVLDATLTTQLVAWGWPSVNSDTGQTVSLGASLELEGVVVVMITIGVVAEGVVVVSGTEVVCTDVVAGVVVGATELELILGGVGGGLGVVVGGGFGVVVTIFEVGLFWTGAGEVGDATLTSPRQ